MKPQINMIGILTDDVPRLMNFYRDVLGFPVKLDMGEYVEFESPGVRFALSARATMKMATGDASYQTPHAGHSFELAFLCDAPSAVDTTYDELVKKGATPIKPAADMPWGQRTAFFADPDGNIHEIFANLES